jgi:hypothetical protein
MSNVLFFSGLGSWLTHWNYQKSDGLLKELESLLSNTDRLTGLHNRRYFDLRLQEEIALAKRNDTATALLMLDVDHFKNTTTTTDTSKVMNAFASLAPAYVRSSCGGRISLRDMVARSSW